MVVTGAGGGLGGRTAELFAARGWQVVAADLDAPASAPGITGVAVDVTDPDSLAQLAETVRRDHDGRLDVVITFAGILGIGPLATMDPDTVAQVLDVNVMGTVRTVHALFPLLHANHGRVVLIGSETGPQHAMPMNGPYAMSKHAIEAYADALRRELMFLGLQVVMVQPGPFRTGMTASIRRRFDDAASAGSPFAAMAAVMGEKAASADATAADPGLLAEAAWHATVTPAPRDRYAVGWDRGRRALDALPVRVVDHLLLRGLGPAIRRHSRGAG